MRHARLIDDAPMRANLHGALHPVPRCTDEWIRFFQTACGFAAVQKLEQ
jgi:hypothetical protein